MVNAARKHTLNRACFYPLRQRDHMSLSGRFAKGVNLSKWCPLEAFTMIRMKLIERRIVKAFLIKLTFLKNGGRPYSSTNFSRTWKKSLSNNDRWGWSRYYYYLKKLNFRICASARGISNYRSSGTMILRLFSLWEGQSVSTFAAQKLNIQKPCRLFCTISKAKLA